MLVLSRRKEESVVVGDNIRIVVVDIRGDKVRLGIEAPADVNVYRSEILEKMRAEGVAPTDGADARRSEGFFAQRSQNDVPKASVSLDLSREKARFSSERKERVDDDKTERVL